MNGIELHESAPVPLYRFIVHYRDHQPFTRPAFVFKADNVPLVGDDHTQHYYEGPRDTYFSVIASDNAHAVDKAIAMWQSIFESHMTDYQFDVRVPDDFEVRPVRLEVIGGTD